MAIAYGCGSVYDDWCILALIMLQNVHWSENEKEWKYVRYV